MLRPESTVESTHSASDVVERRSASIVRRNVLANFIGSGWSALMTILFIPVYIRALGIEAYAMIGLLPVLHAWLSFIDAAITSTISREMARHAAGARTEHSIAALLRSAEAVCIVIAVVIALALFALDRTIATTWLNPRALSVETIARGIDLIGVLVALRLVEGIYHGALVGLQRLVWYNTWAAAFSTVRNGGAALVVLLVSPTIEAFFAWQILVSIAMTALFAWQVHRSIPRPADLPPISRNDFAQVWRFAAGTSAVTVLAILLSQVDKLLLSWLLSLEAFGYYMLASSVASVMYLAVVPLAQAVYPRMVELMTHDRKRELALLYHRSAQIITVIAGTAAAVLFVFPADVIYVWSGDRQLATSVASILAPAVLGTFLHGISNIPYQLQLASGWTGLALRSNFVAAAFYLPALLWVVPEFGAVGAAWLWVALNATTALVTTPLMHRRLLRGEYGSWLVSDVLLPFSAAMLVAAGATLLQWPESNRRLITVLLIGTGLAALTLSAIAVPRLLRSGLSLLKKQRG